MYWVILVLLVFLVFLIVLVVLVAVLFLVLLSLLLVIFLLFLLLVIVSVFLLLLVFFLVLRCEDPSLWMYREGCTGTSNGPLLNPAHVSFELDVPEMYREHKNHLSSF